MLRASLPSSGRPSVRLSIRPSVTLVICIKTVQARITKSSLWAAPRSLVYRDKISCHWVQGFLSNEGVKEGYPPKDYLRTGTDIGFHASRELCSNYLSLLLNEGLKTTKTTMKTSVQRQRHNERRFVGSRIMLENGSFTLCVRLFCFRGGCISFYFQGKFKIIRDLLIKSHFTGSADSQMP